MTDHLTQAAQAALARLIREVEARGMEMAAGMARDRYIVWSDDPTDPDDEESCAEIADAILRAAAKHWKAQHD